MLIKGILSTLLVMLVCSNVLASSRSIPDELYEGMIQFELDSGRYFDALVLMDEAYKKSHSINYLSALQGFNIHQDLPALIEQAKNQKNLTDADYFSLGKSEYLRDECMSALKLFKKIEGNVPLEIKEPLAFYRSNCFIKLGSNHRAGQSLNTIVGGMWAAYGYYNLAISLASSSRDKTKALGTLSVAESLNKDSNKESKSLNDRINLVAGKLLLESNKKDIAIQFFKKVYLDSESSPAALYFSGLAHLELGDFRAATQAWHTLKSYPLINQSVSEALLAIPFAFERSGYISQTIEAYLEASNSFEAELEKIDKLDGALTKHGAVKIFIDDSESEGLEWYLKDVVKNTDKAAYYQYMMQDYGFYDQVKLYSELSVLQSSLDFWSGQLAVFEKSLRNKVSSFRNKQSTFDAPSVIRDINTQKQQLDTLLKEPGMNATLASNLEVEAMKNSIEVLRLRVDSLQQKIQKGEQRLNDQLSDVKRLGQDINSIERDLKRLLGTLGEELTKAARLRLATLKKVMVSNFERSEQGLIHIFEDMAESKQMKKRNLLDGRYQ